MPEGTVWLMEGKLVVNENNSPIVCEVCPCDTARGYVLALMVMRPANDTPVDADGEENIYDWCDPQLSMLLTKVVGDVDENGVHTGENIIRIPSFNEAGEPIFIKVSVTGSLDKYHRATHFLKRHKDYNGYISTVAVDLFWLISFQKKYSDFQREFFFPCGYTEPYPEVWAGRPASGDGGEPITWEAQVCLDTYWGEVANTYIPRACCQQRQRGLLTRVTMQSSKCVETAPGQPILDENGNPYLDENGNPYLTEPTYWCTPAHHVWDHWGHGNDWYFECCGAGGGEWMAYIPCDNYNTDGHIPFSDFISCCEAAAQAAADADAFISKRLVDPEDWPLGGVLKEEPCVTCFNSAPYDGEIFTHESWGSWDMGPGWLNAQTSQGVVGILFPLCPTPEWANGVEVEYSSYSGSERVGSGTPNAKEDWESTIAVIGRYGGNKEAKLEPITYGDLYQGAGLISGGTVVNGECIYPVFGPDYLSVPKADGSRENGIMWRYRVEIKRSVVVARRYTT